MKNFIIAVCLLLAHSSIFAQRAQVDLNYSTSKQVGGSVYQVTKSGFIWGVGGSYLFATYTGETGGKFQELATVSLGKDGDKLSLAFRTNNIYKNFIEDRGTTKLLLGKQVGKTAVYSSVGLAFRSEYWAGKGYDFLPGFTSPERYFYIYKNISPRFLYGITASHLISETFGFNVGYDNVAKFSAGVTFRFNQPK